MKFIPRAVQTSDLRLFGCIKDGQAHELSLLIDQTIADLEGGPGKPVFPDGLVQALADALVKDADRIIDILSTKETSRPGARKLNGAVRKKRKTKEELAMEKARQQAAFDESAALKAQQRKVNLDGMEPKGCEHGVMLTEPCEKCEAIKTGMLSTN